MLHESTRSHQVVEQNTAFHGHTNVPQPSLSSPARGGPCSSSSKPHMGQTRRLPIPHHVPSPRRSSTPSSTCPRFPTTHTATLLHGSCLSQNTYNFNTLKRCWKTTVMLLWNRRPHPNSTQNQRPRPLGMVFPNTLPPRPQPPKATWSSPHLGPSRLERARQKAEQMLIAKMPTMTRGSHTTNKQKGSHRWYHLLPARGTGRAFLYRTQTAFPMHITTTKPYFCSSPSNKPTDFLPSLLGECGDPILTPQPCWGDHVDKASRTQRDMSLPAARNQLRLFIFI